jgi:hypothetical protein
VFSCSEARLACAAAVVITLAPADLRAQQRACDVATEVTLYETVIDRATRVPLRDAIVTLTWSVTGSARLIVARTDSSGRAQLCAPAGRPTDVRVTYRDVQSEAVMFDAMPRAPQTHTTPVDAPHMTLVGQVLDRNTAAPVVNATVRLVPGTTMVNTGADGRFALPLVPLGVHDLRIEHTAYTAATTRIDTDSDDAMPIVRLTALAIPLAPVIVTTTSPRLDAAGFYDRQRRGVGSFIGRAQIDAARPQFPSDLLRAVPGIRLITTPMRRGVRTVTTGRGDCRFRFVVDGTRTLPDFEIDGMPLTMIEGIEVYTGMAQVPAAFRGAADVTGASCGVIALWLRDGR